LGLVGGERRPPARAGGSAVEVVVRFGRAALQMLAAAIGTVCQKMKLIPE